MNSYWAFILLIFLSSSCLAKTITIRADEWYPMNGDPESDKPGYMIELAKAIFEPHGYKVDYQLMPWKKALASVNAGFKDCVVGAVKDEAPALHFPNYHWGLDHNGLYVLADDDWEFDGNIESLRRRKVAVILGYFYGDELDAYFKSNVGQAVQYVDDKEPLKTNINKLLKGKVDTIIETIPVMNARLKETGLKKKIRLVASVGEPSVLYIACHGKQKKLIELIDQAMPNLRRNGHLKSTLDRYDIPLWK